MQSGHQTTHPESGNPNNPLLFKKQVDPIKSSAKEIGGDGVALGISNPKLKRKVLNRQYLNGTKQDDPHLASKSATLGSPSWR